MKTFSDLPDEKVGYIFELTCLSLAKVIYRQHDGLLWDHARMYAPLSCANVGVWRHLSSSPVKNFALQEQN